MALGVPILKHFRVYIVLQFLSLLSDCHGFAEAESLIRLT